MASASAPVSPVTGKIIRLVREKMYGFVQLPDGREPFFHRSRCDPPGIYDDLVEDETIVTGRLEPGPDGRLRFASLAFAEAEDVDAYVDAVGARGNRL